MKTFLTKNLGLLALVFFSISLAACNSVQTPVERFKGQPASEIYKGGVHDMLHHNYNGASDHFTALDALYPFSTFSQQAQLDMIYTTYKQDDVASTLAAADRYIHLYPRGKNVDYAYYMRGLTQMNANVGIMEKVLPYDPSTRDLTSQQKAYMDFDLLLKEYPHSKYTPDSVQRMIYIRNSVAEHNLEIAGFYYKHKQYVSSANRANDVIMGFQETPSVPGALVMMARSYRQLGLKTQEAQVIQVIEMNYPNSRYVKDAMKSS